MRRSERVKYLEGYLLAQRHDAGAKDQFSQSANWYAERITTELERRQKARENLDTPIEDILATLKDKRQPGPSDLWTRGPLDLWTIWP